MPAIRIAVFSFVKLDLHSGIGITPRVKLCWNSHALPYLELGRSP